MNLIHRILSGGRTRTAAKRLAKDPSSRHYAELVHEYAVAGDLDEAIKVAGEGLRTYPGDAELKRLADRSRQLLLEGRTRELQEELKSAPRPALWKELCEILLESGRVARAEELATEWYHSAKSGEAEYYRARARAERFYADRRRDDGRLALELVASAKEQIPSDARPIQLELDIASHCGAWTEARRALARLLEITPGDPVLEARFRTVANLAQNTKTMEQALREVERSGRLVDEPQEANVNASEDSERATAGSVRPMLQSLTREAGVQAAFYVRGGTALVQGPKGATAERTARGVREIVQSCKSAARRLGLGQAQEVRLEGSFGTLLVAPGELGSGALWCVGPVTRRHEEGLRDLAGLASKAQEVKS
ncbi:MAG: tetratricopeptide repeat protein [Planctomycetota bacterium]